ncbi:MAG: hypothetical protein U0790_02065 [Isosphaeraceae bacterium]
MPTLHLPGLTGLVGVIFALFFLVGSEASAGESAGNVPRGDFYWTSTGPKYDAPPSSEALVQQHVLMFFAIVILAVSALRGKEVISSSMTVRLLGASIVLATSVFLAYSQIDPGRLTPAVAMLGVSMGLLFSRTEVEERANLDRRLERPAPSPEPQPSDPSKGHLAMVHVPGQGSPPGGQPDSSGVTASQESLRVNTGSRVV